MGVLLAMRCATRPVAQPRHRSAYVCGHIMTYESEAKHAIKPYKQAIRLVASQAWYGKPLLDCPVHIDTTFVTALGNSRLRKRKPMPRSWKDTKPDLDNLDKAVRDSLEGIVLKNDSRICDSASRKVWGAAIYWGKDLWWVEESHILIVLSTPGEL